MNITVKLTSQVSGKAAYFNTKHIFFFAETKAAVDVCVEEICIEIKESWGELRKLAAEHGFIEFVRVANMKRVLINASLIKEWHEQYGGVFLEFGGKGITVQGTLQEITEKIEKALDVETKKGDK